MFDLWRISRAQKLPFRDLSDPCIDATCSAGSVALDASDDRYLPILQRNPRDDSACVNLMRVGDDISRCGIYATRPEICDAYPFEMVRGSIDLRPDVGCAPDAWNLATLDYHALRTRHEHFLAEWDAHARATAVFTHRAESGDIASAFAVYLDFCEAICDRTVAPRSENSRVSFALNRVVACAREVNESP